MRTRGLLPSIERREDFKESPKFFSFNLRDGGRNKGGRGRENVSQSPLKNQKTVINQGRFEEISRKIVQLVIFNTGMKIPNEGTLSQTEFDDPI